MLWYRQVLLPTLDAAAFNVWDPWADVQGATRRALEEAEAAPDGERLTALRSINERLGRHNSEAITAAAALLAVLDGPDVDSGTAAEVGYAAGLGKPVVGLRTDLRPAGDNAGAIVNLQVEHFVTRNGGSICPTLAEAIGELVRLTSE